MRIARKLFLLTAMALTAMALTATSASAQETPVEVVNESTGEHCDTSGTPNCVVHAVGGSELHAHIFGFETEISSCNDEFVASIGEDGTGVITDVELTGANCNVVPCEGAEGQWPISDTGETATNEGHMTVRFCIIPDLTGSPTHCDVEIGVSEPANHVYHFVADDESCPSAELTGEWETQNNAIEILHL